MPNAHCFSYTLDFTFSAGTSRGVMTTRDTYFVVLEQDGRRGTGECAPLPNLSEDYAADMLPVLRPLVQSLADQPLPKNERAIADQLAELIPDDLPSVHFALETALLDWLHGGTRRIASPKLLPTLEPIAINGLVWMGEPDFMRRQIDEKIAQGFRCIKLKIGAIDFDEELKLLAYVRQRHHADELTLRVDANGAFSPDEALNKLHRLADYDIHSIEQPIRAGQPEAMARLCRESPVPIALDEELIGVRDRAQLLDAIQPQYIILKPSLVGGLAASDDWIRHADERNIGWWATSALESNIGLNAIAQWAMARQRAAGAPLPPQGLGTGQLYHNNIDSPIVIEQGQLRLDSARAWDLLLFE